MKQSASFQGLNIDKNSIINLEKGKLPPQAIDLEEVVLGAMMIDKKGVDEVIDILTPEAFYKESHQLIFQSIFSLFGFCCSCFMFLTYILPFLLSTYIIRVFIFGG